MTHRIWDEEKLDSYFHIGLALFMFGAMAQPLKNIEKLKRICKYWYERLYTAKNLLFRIRCYRKIKIDTYAQWHMYIIFHIGIHKAIQYLSTMWLYYYSNIMKFRFLDKYVASIELPTASALEEKSQRCLLKWANVPYISMHQCKLLLM